MHPMMGDFLKQCFPFQKKELTLFALPICVTVSIFVDEKALLQKLLQQKMKDITMAMKELANRYDDMEKSPGLFNKSQQRPLNNENKKLIFGLKGETALRKIMEKAQKMPLEYDDLKSFLDAVQNDSLSEKNLEGPSDKLKNNASLWEKYSIRTGATVLDLSVLLLYHVFICCTVYLF